MSFIKLTVNNTALVLNKNTTLRFELKAPYPTEQQLPVVSTYSFSIPKVHINRMVFKYAENLNIKTRQSRFDAILQLGNIQIRGSLNIIDINKNNYNVMFSSVNKIIKLTKKNLPEIFKEDAPVYFAQSDSIDDIVEAARTFSSVPFYGEALEQSFVFPTIHSPNFFPEETNTSFKEYINNFDDNSAVYSYIKNYVSDDGIHNENVLVPMIWLFALLDRLFAKAGLTLSGSVYNNIDFRHLILYNNTALQRFSEVKNFTAEIAELKRKPGVFYHKILRFENINDSQQIYYPPLRTFYTNSDKIHLKLSVEIFCPKGAITLLGIVINGKFEELIAEASGIQNYNLHEIDTIININSQAFKFAVHSTRYPPITDERMIKDLRIEIANDFTATDYDSFFHQIHLKNHLPNVSFTDFFNDLIRKFAWAVFFNTKKNIVEITSWNEILDSNEYLDLTECLIKNSEKIIIQTKRYSYITNWENDDFIENNFKETQGIREYNSTAQWNETPPEGRDYLLDKYTNKIYKYNRESNTPQWEFYCDNFYNVKHESSQAQEISTNINTLFMGKYSDNETIVPKIAQQGTCRESGKNECGIKLLNFWGLEFRFPYSSNSPYYVKGEYDASNAQKLSGIELQNTGENGLFKRFSEKLYNYLQKNDAVQMDFIINEMQLYKLLSMYEAGSTIRKIRVGAKNYIAEKLDIEIDNIGIKSCKITLR